MSTVPPGSPHLNLTSPPVERYQQVATRCAKVQLNEMWMYNVNVLF